MLTSCQNNPSFSKTPSSKNNPDTVFEQFTDEIFRNEITSNTLNLHYSIEDPKSCGITDYAISLGDYSKQARSETQRYLSQLNSELTTHPYSALSLENQLTYDLLSDYLTTQLALHQYELYEEPLSYSGGMQMQLPILFAEYELQSKQDVQDYLALLGCTDEYFAQIMEFEKEKADAGLFMSAEQCQAVIESCSAFLEKTDEHYLITTFENRIQKLDLNKIEITAYCKKNKEILTEQLFPAYEAMIADLKTLQNKGKNPNGLSYFAQGKDYYALLVYALTGCNDSPEKLFHRIEQQRLEDLVACTTLQTNNKTLLEEGSSFQLPTTDPNTILALLQQKIQDDFPAPPACTYTIHYVDSALEEYLAPAFYIVAPLDDYTENTIYLNKGHLTDNLYTFTTLAHEGYPGHLYQTVMSYEYELPLVRSILGYAGFTEGWATYIEMMSYAYTGMPEDFALLLAHNQSATLSLYASSDIGIHYYGWTKEDMYNFWSSYGICDTDVINEITQLILSEPGNYLQYYVGYIEFLELLDYARATLGNDFSLKEFHRAVLDIGPAPFSILEKYLTKYYRTPQT